MNNFSVVANSLLRNTLTLYLFITLKRQPTEDELFEEFMCLMDGKIKTEFDFNEIPIYGEGPHPNDTKVINEFGEESHSYYRSDDEI